LAIEIFYKIYYDNACKRICKTSFWEIFIKGLREEMSTMFLNLDYHQLTNATAKPQQETENKSALLEDLCFVVEKGESLLGQTERHQQLMQRLEYLAGMGDLYVTFYQQILQNFAEFVQYIPDINGKDFNVSMLNVALLRAVALLEQLSAYGEQERDTLWQYAAFTAVLMRDLGSICRSRRILCCDAQGEVTGIWSPIEGPMAIGQHYRIQFMSTMHQKISQFMTIPLALSLMPKEGLAWIQQDELIYLMWLAYLGQDETDRGDFAVILERIVAKVNPLDLPLQLEKVGFESKAGQQARDFLRWLKSQIKNKKIAMNTSNAPIQVHKHGVWISKAVLGKYFNGQVRSQYGVSLQKIFNNLGVASYGDHDFSFRSSFGALAKHSAKTYEKNEANTTKGGKVWNLSKENQKKVSSGSLHKSAPVAAKQSGGTEKSGGVFIKNKSVLGKTVALAAASAFFAMPTEVAQDTRLLAPQNEVVVDGQRDRRLHAELLRMETL
jgi:hypothetical protein